MYFCLKNVLPRCKPLNFPVKLSKILVFTVIHVENVLYNALQKFTIKFNMNRLVNIWVMLFELMLTSGPDRERDISSTASLLYSIDQLLLLQWNLVKLSTVYYWVSFLHSMKKHVGTVFQIYWLCSLQQPLHLILPVLPLTCQINMYPTFVIMELWLHFTFLLDNECLLLIC